MIPTWSTDGRIRYNHRWSRLVCVRGGHFINVSIWRSPILIRVGKIFLGGDTALLHKFIFVFQRLIHRFDNVTFRRWIRHNVKFYAVHSRFSVASFDWYHSSVWMQILSRFFPDRTVRLKRLVTYKYVTGNRKKKKWGPISKDIAQKMLQAKNLVPKIRWDKIHIISCV